MHGKTLFISGATSGIGLHLTKTFIQKGIKRIILASRSSTNENPIIALLRKEAPQTEIVPLQLDMSHKKVETKLESFLDQFKNDIDVVINNAGIALTKPVLQTDWNDISQVMQTNMYSHFIASKVLGQYMIHRKTSGSIINVGSLAGEKHMKNLAVYGASKAALHHVTRSFALELASHNIRVNAIVPGYFMTEINRGHFKKFPQVEQKLIQMIPMKRMGQLNELDQLTLMLANNDASSYITGSLFPIDGGMSLN